MADKQQRAPPTIVSSTYVVSGPSYYGPEPIRTVCTRCSSSIVTMVHHDPGTLSWLLCALCLLFGCWLGCCLIPLCTDACMDVEHFCPKCNTLLNRHRRV